MILKTDDLFAKIIRSFDLKTLSSRFIWLLQDFEARNMYINLISWGICRKTCLNHLFASVLWFLCENACLNQNHYTLDCYFSKTFELRLFCRCLSFSIFQTIIRNNWYNKKQKHQEIKNEEWKKKVVPIVRKWNCVIHKYWKKNHRSKTNKKMESNNNTFVNFYNSKNNANIQKVYFNHRNQWQFFSTRKAKFISTFILLF